MTAMRSSVRLLLVTIKVQKANKRFLKGVTNVRYFANRMKQSILIKAGNLKISIFVAQFHSKSCAERYSFLERVSLLRLTEYICRGAVLRRWQRMQKKSARRQNARLEV